jgi:hypothetical protein
MSLFEPPKKLNQSHLSCDLLSDVVALILERMKGTRLTACQKMLELRSLDALTDRPVTSQTIFQEMVPFLEKTRWSSRSDSL